MKLKNIYKKLILEWHPGQEELRYFSDLERKQEQIYYDAADLGIPVRNINIKNQIKKELQELVGIYGQKKNSWTNGASSTVFFVIEKDGPQWSGIEIEVSWHKDSKLKTIYKKDYDEFFSISLKRKSLTEKEISAKYNDKFFK